MTRMTAAVMSAVIALLAFGAAQAGETNALTSDEARRFVATLEDVQALGDRLEANGEAEALNIRTQPKAGEAFRPYSTAVAALKADYPAEHARLSAIVGQHGFSAQEWGAVGDQVMIAYLAEKMEQENPGALQQMAQMDSSMKEIMPAHMKEQMAAALALAQAAKDAPAENRAAIKPVMADLDAFTEEGAEQ